MADDLAPSRELALEQGINAGGPDSGLGLEETEPCPQGLGLVSSLTFQVSGSLWEQAAHSMGRRASPSYPPQTTSQPCKKAFFKGLDCNTGKKFSNLSTNKKELSLLHPKRGHESRNNETEP